MVVVVVVVFHPLSSAIQYGCVCLCVGGWVFVWVSVWVSGGGCGCVKIDTPNIGNSK